MALDTREASATSQDRKGLATKRRTPHEIDAVIDRLAERLSLLEDVVVPALAMKEELRIAKVMLRDELADLRQEIATLTTKEELRAGIADAKRYALLMLHTTRGEVRLLAQQTATKGDLERLQQVLSKQIATLRAPGRKKQ
jgi:hypothetical protein